MAFKKGKDVNLTGKTAVITGAGSGIGAATARLLAQHGGRST
jgi:NAD(P)-dependent dehydrogenase (short-subunit alcohol dehydrogenase family)